VAQAIPQSRGALAPGKRPGCGATSPIQPHFDASLRLWQIAPWRTGSQHPEDAVQHAAVIYARHATGFVGEKRFDHAPFGISQVISAHASHESDFAVT
jgi:hypothetical protein